MATSKQELKRLCTEINASKLAKITIFWNRKFSKEHGGVNTEGLVYSGTKPPSIYLQKTYETTYKELILSLFHEIGHVIDAKRYKKCKRLQIWDKYYFTDYELEKIKNFPKYVKFAFLHTEYIAEKYVQKLVKKFNLDLNKPFTKDEFDINSMRTVKVYKYEFLYGKSPIRKLQKLWRKQLKKTPVELTLEYIKDVDKI